MITFKNKLKNSLGWHRESGTGFTIIELIIAIAVLSFGVVLVYGAFFVIIDATFNLSSRYTALYLGQEGLEIIRNMRDNNVKNNVSWTAGLLGDPCKTGCVADYKMLEGNQLAVYNNDVLGLDGNNFYSVMGSTPTIFKRKITITQISGKDEVIKVLVEVFWTYNSKSFALKNIGYLYNIEP